MTDRLVENQQDGVTTLTLNRVLSTCRKRAGFSVGSDLGYGVRKHT